MTYRAYASPIFQSPIPPGRRSYHLKRASPERPQVTTQKPRSRTDSAQAKRFIEAAREAGCSEDEAEIRENMKRFALVQPKPTLKPQPPK